MKLLASLLLSLILAACGGGGGGSPAPAQPVATADPGYTEHVAAGEPYLLHCAAKPTRLVLYLHTWSGDHRQVLNMYPDGIAGSCVVSPNFEGPNTTAQALGSDQSLADIQKAVRDAQARTGLMPVDLIAASGGTLAALNYIGKYGGIRTASIWLVIHDLATLYTTTQDKQLPDNMLQAIGHPPSGADDPDYLARSPITRLETVSGPVVIHMNVAANDISTPPAQGRGARDQLLAHGISVVYQEWPMGHVFDAPQQSEAIRQLQ